MDTIKTYNKVVALNICFWIIVFTCSNSSGYKKYLEQKPPSMKPEIFAPGLISKDGESEFGSVFNNAATEFYYAVDVNGKSEIRYTRLKGKTWSEPQVLLAHDQYSCNDPFLSPDENRLYFISNKAILSNEIKEDYDIWYLEREGNGWNPKMINAGSNINTNKNEYYMSFTRNGDMYFSSNVLTTEKKEHNFDIYVTRYGKGAFQEAVSLDKTINTSNYEADVFVAPNESYIIFCSVRKEGYGKGDLYVSFRGDDGNWSEAKNMGSLINTNGHELCPFVTRDGKYFFYTSNRDIYWVDADIIYTLKN